jgi:hypothetical protein
VLASCNVAAGTLQRQQRAAPATGHPPRGSHRQHDAGQSGPPQLAGLALQKQRVDALLAAGSTIRSTKATSCPLTLMARTVVRAVGGRGRPAILRPSRSRINTRSPRLPGRHHLRQGAFVCGRSWWWSTLDPGWWAIAAILIRWPSGAPKIAWWWRALAARRAACQVRQQGPASPRAGRAQPIEIGIGCGALLDQGHQAHQLLVVAHLQIVTKTAAQVVGAQAAHHQHRQHGERQPSAGTTGAQIFRRGMGMDRSLVTATPRRPLRLCSLRARGNHRTRCARRRRCRPPPARSAAGPRWATG